jgi:hypothetical protein
MCHKIINLRFCPLISDEVFFFFLGVSFVIHEQNSAVMYLAMLSPLINISGKDLFLNMKPLEINILKEKNY